MFSHLKYVLISVFFFGLLPLSTGKVVVLNGLTHMYELQEGEVRKGIIEVKNLGDNKESVLIYQTDFSFNYKGETQYGTPSSMERSNAEWLEISPISVTLNPNEQKEIVFTIKVPEKVEHNGTYWSAVMVEPTQFQEEQENQDGLRIRSIFRYAVQIITNVNGSGTKELDFVNVGLSNEETGSYLNVDVMNKGDSYINASMNLELFDNQGHSLVVFESKKSRTLPGTSKRYVVNIPKLEKGNYQAMLLAESEGGEAFGVQLSLEIEDE